MDKKIIFTLLITIGILLSATNTQAAFTKTVYNTNGNYNYTAITSLVLVEAWGAGGSGGAGSGGIPGGGGGGGGYARSYINVTPGTIYNLSVGAGAIGIPGIGGAGTNGNPSWFLNTTTIYADYGKGGGYSASGTAAGGLGGTNNTGQYKTNGATGGASNGGSAGGGAGGDINNATGLFAGNRGGNGGKGGNSTIGTGGDANYPGGGGGAGYTGNPSGASANGKIIIYAINESYSEYYVNILDEINQSNIIGNNVSYNPISNSSGGETYTNTTNSKLYIPPVPISDPINLKVSATNYALRTLVLFGQTNNTQNTNMYLAQGTTSILFSIIDQVTGISINQALLSMYRDQGNGTIIPVQIGYSDITGLLTTQVIPNTRYLFIVTNPTYTSKSFVLDPVIYSSYTLKLLQNTGNITFGEDYQNVYITYDPKIFYANQSNTITFVFNSLTNTFTNYSYYMTYPGGNKTGIGNNTAGTTFITTFNITGGNVFSTVNITINYTTLILGTHTFNFQHGIIYGPQNGTLAANQGNTYGMGLIERALVGTVIIIIFAGIITVALGSTIGLTLALFLMGVFVKMGFWEWWLAGISLIIGIIIIIKRSDS